MKANPDTALRFAVKLVRIDRLSRKAFNQAMRTRFPRISEHTLYNVRQDAKILLAIEHVRRTERDE
jgi:hypothetical protein